MSDYERQLEEALARKARESEKARKSVQSEARLISSLRQALDDHAETSSEAGGSSGMSLEEMLAEKSRKQIASWQEKRPVSAAENEPQKKETPVKRVEPVESVEPVKSADPVKSAEPIKSADPVKSAEPVKSSEQIKNAEPVVISPVVSVPKTEPAVKKPESSEYKESSRKDPVSVVLAVLMAVFLAAAGIGGGLFYALFTYIPMADAVDNSACAAVLEGEYLDGLNTLAEEEGLDIAFTREVLISGQAVRDLKASLRAVYSGAAYQPETKRIGEKIEAYAEGAGTGRVEQFAAKAGEVYSSIIGAAPDSSWIGQTGSLRLILLGILAGGILISVILLVLLSKRGRAGSLARFSFAGAALLIEILSVIVMTTGVFSRYSADYSYIMVLSNKYTMGGIVACMVVGVLYMVLALEAAAFSARK